MIQKIIQAINANPSVNDWKINITENRSAELFYVGKKLETNRATNTTEYTVTLYSDQETPEGQMRGSASFSVYDYMTEADLEKKVADNVYAASFALNPWYGVPAPEEKEIPASSSNIAALELKQAAELVSDAVFKADHFEGGYLSATEIFVHRIARRVLNSRGIDVAAVSYNGMVELIPSWKEDDKDVEIYHMLRFESLDPEKITAEVEEKLTLVHARCDAKNLADVMNTSAPCKVILQDMEVGEMFHYFAKDLTYASKYTHSNRAEIGDSVQGESVTGTPLTMSMASYVKDAFYSASFDSDGVILKDTPIIENGKAVNMYGSYRMGQYLQVETPTGDLPIMVVTPGTKTFAAMTTGPYLRCVVFSGLQVESNSGYFGGEVRLGFYFDGEKEIPVTGFSISGNFKEAAGSMVYSAETVTCAFYQGPKYLEITGMSMA